MKRLPFLLLLSLVFLHCAPEHSGNTTSAASGQAMTDTLGAPAGETQASAARPVKAETETDSRKAEEKPEVGSRAANQPPQSGQVLTLNAKGGEAKAGGKVCVDVQVRDFNNLLSMQYTMAWDANLLAFTDIRNFGLPGLNGQNFGAHRTAEGLLTFVWIDGTLRGVTIPDNSTIFSVCFDVKGQAGQAATFRFTDKPTAFESVDVNEELVRINPVEGKVAIR